MKYSVLLIALSIGACGSAKAMERYTEARIAQVEASDSVVVVFLDSITGDTPPTGNGLSNAPVVSPIRRRPTPARILPIASTP